ncbi:TPA: N-acetylmuramoyl-L-alanine amidase [Corynebacterium striatum]|nr:N-acetylmuramoyl-L-alanine amidase [Corynebacterium striatum]HCD1826160.1 N-acetylmuramoyl-L-alanine amidase [Corynebacterium striatum]HCD2182112.1 N-acetylmuramoyl-L-alanine amidase [Corynebacterium striatum]HCD2851985.1 N-acetylmuramoyl-L-alanine amidase [Corynebacterium striatum]HCD3732139.1 N-acetylmuramoyl-L-alanine amidase [Corynebacterium striatum]
MPNAYKTTHTLLTANDDGIAGTRRLLAVHTFEGQDLDAVAMARYQQSPAAAGSYHLVIDRDGASARENDDEYIPWAAMYTGNRAAFHFSLAGRAAMTRDEWLARPAQLETLAQVLAAYSKAYGIPLIRRDAADLARGAWGVCGHADISGAWHESDHTDPGPGFPFDVVIDRAKAILAEALDPNRCTPN